MQYMLISFQYIHCPRPQILFSRAEVPYFFHLAGPEDLRVSFKHFHFSSWDPTNVPPPYYAEGFWDYFYWLSNLGNTGWSCRNMETQIYGVSSLVMTY